MKISKIVAGTALAITLAAGAAEAAPIGAPITGSAAIVADSTTGVATANTTIDLTGVRFAMPASGAFSDVMGVVSLAISNFSVTLTTGTAVSFTSSQGDYSGTVNVSSGMNGSFQFLQALGTFVPSGDLASAGYTGNGAVIFRLTVNQAGQSLSSSATLDAVQLLPVPVGVPEPMGLALFGMGLAGLGMVARRKQA